MSLTINNRRFIMVHSTVAKALEENCPYFRVSKFLDVTHVYPIVSDEFLVIIGDNITAIGYTKTTILIMNLSRVVVATYSMDSRIYKDKEDFSLSCVNHFMDTLDLSYYDDYEDEDVPKKQSFKERLFKVFK